MILDREGHFKEFQAVGRDITERKHMEEALEERVAERTSELSSANELLRREIAERQRAQELLKRVNRQLAKESRQRRLLAERRL